MTHPPGEPPAEALAEQLADVVIVGGPRAGEVWTYEGDHGGYLPLDPKIRMGEEVPMLDVGALITHTQAVTVRPVPNEE